ncbi:uncharacterized protein B0H18DRAFT_1130471 [Fomitopsis serialis]|uniref:uncharacterized protein n=1 Tax=Fomitopsis serialis TaxID=139415 RepID=UPI00200880E6|nr:uncharacterized protein B0H18DRAFT_1130471 [Neoantrodia serialis]KAH9910261.1 hypothetical protein B0H18DRAFT_1130471 [Neoantrodia serialis]
MLPASVKSLVSAAQNCLHLHIALKAAWTKETSITSNRLPSSDKMIGACIRKAHLGHGKSNKHNADLKKAFQMLQGLKAKKDGDLKARKAEVRKEMTDEEREAMRKKVYTVVWTCSSQTRNELKKKAKQVVEQVFKLNGLSVAQRTEIAGWLLETHSTTVTDGSRKRNIANFVFGGIEFHFDRKKKLDRERMKVEPTEPFRSDCIPELIYQYYGLAGHPDASINSAFEEFSKVPLNLIALSCNAIEAALMEVALHNQATVTVFSNKNFAGKWDGVMAVLETLEDRATDYLEETHELIWKDISTRLNATPDAVEVSGDEQPGGFIPLLQLHCGTSKPRSHSKEPGTSKAATATKPLSSTAKAKPSSSSKTTKNTESAKGKKTPPSSKKTPPSPSKKPRSAGAASSKSRKKQRGDQEDEGDKGEAGGEAGSGDDREGDAGGRSEVNDGEGVQVDELQESGQEPVAGTPTEEGA